MTSRIGEETRRRIARVWPDILGRLADGELIKDVLAHHGLSRYEVDAYKLEAPQRRVEWDTAREASADEYMDRAMQEALRDDVTHLQASHIKTRIDTLKWAARIRNPRLYGDKAQLDVNVKTVDLTRIIEAANARVLAGQARLIPHNTDADPSLARAQPALLPAVLDATARSLDELM